MSGIKLKNVGKIDSLEIPCPIGGVVVLRGRNGKGKTTALNAVSSLTSGNGCKVSKKDGTLNGEIEGLGVKLTLKASTRIRGTCEVSDISGRFDLAALVDPGLKDEEAADQKRIRALVAMGSDKADAGIFADLLKDTTLICEADDDILGMAGKVKRDLEEMARERERESSELTAKIAIESELAKDWKDGGQLPDTKKAMENYSFAEQNEKITESRRADYLRAKAKAEENKPEWTIEQVEKEISDLESSMYDLNDKIDAANTLIKVLEEELSKKNTWHKVILERARGIASHNAAIAQFQSCNEVTEEDLANARDNKQTAFDELTRETKLAQAKQHFDYLQRLQESLKIVSASAVKFRKKAASVDAVLTGLVAKAKSPLRVESGRLVLDTERGTTLFSDLSEGERWRIVIEIASQNMRENERLLVIPQEAWDALDEINQSEIADIIAKLGLTIITAMDDVNEGVVAEIFKPHVTKAAEVVK